MTRAEIIKGIKDIHSRLYAFTDYRKTTEACLELLENENTMIDRALEVIDETYDEYARHLPIEEFGRGSCLTGQIKDAVLALKGGKDGV